MFYFSSGNCWIELCFDTLVDLREWKKHLEYISFGSGTDKDCLDLVEQRVSMSPSRNVPRQRGGRGGGRGVSGSSGGSQRGIARGVVGRPRRGRGGYLCT